MALGLKRTLSTGGIPVFKKVLETAQGGFKLDVSNIASGKTIMAGSLIGYDETTRIAKLIKTAKVSASVASDGVIIKITKGSFFSIGDKVAKKIGGESYAITAIDDSHDSYDELTIATTIGVLVVGDILFESLGNGETAGAFASTPKGLLYEDAMAVANESISVVIRGTVFENRIAPVSSEAKSLLPTIIFSQSF